MDKQFRFTKHVAKYGPERRHIEVPRAFFKHIEIGDLVEVTVINKGDKDEQDRQMVRQSQ